LLLGLLVRAAVKACGVMRSQEVR